MRAHTEHGFGYPRHVEQTFYAYLDCGILQKRVFGEDILACPRCGHRSTRVIAAIDDPPLVKKILGHLGLPTERVAISGARSPPQLDFDDDFEGFNIGDAELDVN